MAQFIPHELISSPASERTIYDYIKQDERTKNWIVFHSLLIEKHVHNLCGESDFVIIAPEFGCFVIEVKGGDISTSNRDGFLLATTTVYTRLRILLDKLEIIVILFKITYMRIIFLLPILDMGLPSLRLFLKRIVQISNMIRK